MRRFTPLELPDVIKTAEILGISRAARLFGIDRTTLSKIVNGHRYARWTNLGKNGRSGS